MEKKNNIKNKIGERKIMKCGEEAEIVEYKRYSDITVRFIKTGELVQCQYSNFKNGLIKSHVTPSICGVGVVGLEKNKRKQQTIKIIRNMERYA